jgi:hypothetical protein
MARSSFLLEAPELQEILRRGVDTGRMISLACKSESEGHCLCLDWSHAWMSNLGRNYGLDRPSRLLEEDTFSYESSVIDASGSLCL